MSFGLSFQNLNKGKMAYVIGKDLSISTKQSVEICSYLKNKRTTQAKGILQDAINLKQAIPFKRYNKDVSHRKGIVKIGKYPQKASTTIKKLIESVESNAQNQGLDKNNLIIIHMAAHKASKPWHMGRHRRRKMKRTHVEIVVEELVSNQDTK